MYIYINACIYSINKSATMKQSAQTTIPTYQT